MGTYPDQDWLKRSNAQTMTLLEQQGRTGPGLVPFLGAGASQPFGYDNWANLLINAAPPGRVAEKVKAQLSLPKPDYEEAAEALLEGLGADGFQNMVAVAAGDHKIKSIDFRAGTGDARAATVSLLPLLANGPVITTNFDRVLEHAFAANDSAFESVISGPRPDLIVDALHGNRRVLIKLHGDWQDRVGRTFAKSDYDANYGTAQPERKRALLGSAEELLFSSRSLLFIGASLGPDRTVAVLQTVHQRYAGVRHFALMRVPEREEEFDDTAERLSACGVLLLWYQLDKSGGHSEARKMISDVVERISVQTVAGPGPAAPECLTVHKPEPLPSDLPDPKFERHFGRVTRLIEDGRLTFFLGSAIHHPTKLYAREYYEGLARAFECEPLINERDAVAQYIADRHGRDILYAEIRKMLRGTRFVPRNLHEFFASWDDLRTPAGERPPYPMVITTNYDDILERRLANAGVRHHVLSYQADGPHRGRFYHQSPDNSLRVIERPRNVRELSDAFVVVKLNGGLDCQRRIPESYVTARLDYLDLAARIPDVFPAAIRQRLSTTPLLFLGHGLAMPDIESVVRFAHKGHQGPRSWAVFLNEGDVRGGAYWRQCGVEFVEGISIEVYVNELHRRLIGGADGKG